MSWNYRIVRKGEDFGIYEVYYDDTGTPSSISETAVAPTASSLTELRERLEMVLEAFGSEQLDYAMFRDRREDQEP